MQILEAARSGIIEQSDRKLVRMIWIALATVALGCALLIWSHMRTMSSLQMELKQINQHRNEVRKLATRYQRVEAQKKQVESVLQQEPNFKIKEYMKNLIDRLQFPQEAVKQIEVGKPRSVQTGYAEVVLDANLTGITMKQLATLMYEAEKNERVYIKSVTINQQKQARKIDATLTVATLQTQES